MIKNCSYTLKEEAEKPKCKKLPNGCKLKWDIQNNQRLYKYVCSRFDLNFKFNLKQFELNHNCTTSHAAKLYFRLGKTTILDKSFDFLNVYNNYIAPNSLGKYIFLYRNIKGFDIDLPKKYNSDFKIPYWEFYSSSFNFYHKGLLIKSCKDIANVCPITIFHAFGLKSNLYFHNMRKSVHVCSMVLQDIHIRSLNFFGFIDSFYKTNLVKFFSISNNESKRLESTYINSLNLNDFENLKLDKTILHPIVFQNLTFLTLLGRLSSIQAGLFKNFDYLKEISFNVKYFRELVHRDIQWIFDLNHNIRVDLNNSEMMPDDKKLELMYVYLRNVFSMSQKENIYDMREAGPSYLYPNKDFCLWVKFPFHQLVVIEYSIGGTDLTCTYLWLIQYFKIYNRFVDGYYLIFDDDFKIFENLTLKCHFQNRLVLFKLKFFKQKKLYFEI